MTQKKRNKQNKVTLSNLSFHKLNWLEYLTMGLCIWFIIYPKPYNILFTALLCMPIIGLLLNGLTGRPSISSLVEISKNDDGRNKYDVADFIDLAAWAILIRVLIDYEFESFYSLLIPGTIAFSIMLILLFATHKLIDQTTKSKTWIYSSLIFNVLIYSYAGTYGANCTYDRSKPIVYETKVIDKNISKSRKGRRTYYITVNPWGHHYDKEQISIARSRFEEIHVGQKVKIDLKKGLFNIPWYYVE